ncbi:pyridoxine 5'-phosphate synthase [Phreatobacter cathodiphilus]|uniref:Pyridoxine 5'-phosphate synthase n=1 Tax=Phreatobacter cathodiphilus TaxID=1868589 RepID=A0A2S0N6Q8_9HYPH|nr:pyridoxine 5'-phosphate synthase [Phreatobacter cathodiphilus]AVO43796.1 pyridoxine 5'-phosphate synthase [Phreatobacter cathodiphilus]
MPTHLSVNVNAVAQLRNRRNLPWPSVTGLARIALEAGAAGITVHPRPDERHIRRHDVFDLAALLRADFPAAEFNIEGYPDERFLALCEEVKPHQVTLVPDDPAQATSDHGWDVHRDADLLKRVIARLKAKGMRVSIFLDADPALVPAAKATGTDRIELYTGPYGHAADAAVQASELKKLVATTAAATAAGLAVNAGHDLTLDNLPPLVAAAPAIAEVSIGHALTADALIHGMAETVRLYKKACGG